MDVSKKPNFWVYILYCKNHSFYTGYTIDLNRRYHAHLQGTATKYTRSFPPLSIAQAWPLYGKKHQAMQIERFIKKMDRRDKLFIIKNPLSLEKIFIEQAHLKMT